MTKEFTAFHNRNQASCEVCGRPMTHFELILQQDSDHPVCNSFDCKKTMEQKATMPASLFGSYLKFQKKLNAQKQRKQKQRTQRITEVTEKEHRENLSALHSVLQNNPQLSENALHLVVIPSGLSTLTLLEQERIDEYTHHLNNIIEQAIEQADSTEVIFDQHYYAQEKLADVEDNFTKHPDQQSISEQLCTMCKGGCCASGKNHAYLSVITIRKLLANNPDLTAQDILDTYLSLLSPHTMDGSCINHTATGCALPRELRSDICNAFFCDPVKSFHKRFDKRPVSGDVLAIQRANIYSSWTDPDAFNDIVQLALVDEKQIRFIDMTDAD